MNGGLPDVPAGDAEPEWRSEVPDLSGLSPADLPGLSLGDPPGVSLVDLSGVSLSDLPDSVLGESLRRLAAELDDPDEPIAGFNSAL